MGVNGGCETVGGSKEMVIAEYFMGEGIGEFF